MAKYLTEFVGTFFLVLVIGLTVTQGIVLGPLAIGSVLMVMIYMGGHISGGHYNPAVSLATLMRGAMSPADLVPYWIVQVLAAIVAALVVTFITGSSFAPAPGEGYSAFGVEPWLVEVLFTFMLALVVLNSATSSGTTGNSFYGLAIGFTYFVAIVAGERISGGSFNPALGIGPNIIRGLEINNLILHVVGPLLGAALAALVFRIQEAFVESQ